MALDHYISQVHLKNFNSPKLGHLMYAIDKSDLRSFTPFAKSICRIEEGNTNPYLKETRLIEEFLEGIEPKYNAALSRLRNREIDNECVYTIAGFAAYVMTCSPAGMRISSGLLKSALQETIRIHDSQGKLPPSPPILGGRTLSDLIGTGGMRTPVDPKYPQAMGISLIHDYVSILGNCTWEILINNYPDRPFFTSDYPIAIERRDESSPTNRIVPLDPFLALRIIPDLSSDRRVRDFTFPHFNYVYRMPNRKEVTQVNKLIVQCAENTVLFRDHHDWIPRFIRRNSSFRIELVTVKLPNGTGSLLWFAPRICRIEP